MLEEPTVVYSEPENKSTTHVVHALMQFLLAARYRKNVVLTALLVAGLLGGLYYFTATPYYQASASIMVMGSGSDGTSISGPPERGQQRSPMPTFESLFSKTKALQGAVPLLRPEHCIDFAGAPVEAWPAILKANLSTQVLRGTNIIEISYRSKDPKAAVAVVNAVVESYRAFLDETHKGTAAEVSRLFTKEKVETERRLNQTEQQLQWLQARNEVFRIGKSSHEESLHPKVQSVLFFRKALDEVQNERLRWEGSLAALEAAIRNGQDLQQHVLTLANTAGMELLLTKLGMNRYNSYLQAEIERRLVEAQAQLESMQRQGCGPEHPDVLEKSNTIRLMVQFVQGSQQDATRRADEIQRGELGPLLVGMVRQKLKEVWQREANLKAKCEQATAEAIALNGQLSEIERVQYEVEWLRKERSALLNRIADIELLQDGQEVRTALVQEPTEASKPVSPDLRRVILLVLVGGLALGLALVYVLDILDDRFRSVEEIQQQLKTPVLAMVRRLQAPEATGLDALPMHIEPGSVQCEAFRTLRTALELADQEIRQIVVTSSEPGDGKTTVLANLAVSYAQSNKRTLLIDADLRRPGMTALTGMRGADGLSSVIRGDTEVVRLATACIRPSGVERLDVLPSGPRPTNPAELLASPRFSELLAWAETVYDQVLVDSPPTLATSDAAVIGRLVDGVVMVVQPSKNRRRVVFRAKESLTGLKIPLLGIVVNRIGEDSDRGGYYGYAYGYSEQYEGEEQVDALAEDDRHDAALVAGAADRLPDDEADTAAPSVPRRVA
ncbi:MAG: polysaccharide biosynthesis tyrosine autokinase [Pirellulales bacterium]|nr:polysaccharide biosynthesis tyrosine autokinase [Pirellulales bacterium]